MLIPEGSVPVSFESWGVWWGGFLMLLFSDDGNRGLRPRDDGRGQGLPWLGLGFGGWNYGKVTFVVR